MFPLRDDAPRHRFPWVNSLLIAANVAVFVHELTLPQRYLNHVFFPTWGLVPLRYAAFLGGAAMPLAILWLPLFASMFIHAGWFHLLGNMWMLYLFGDNVEDVFGHLAYLWFYLACGLVAAMVQVGFQLNSATPTIGASGAIAGVLGAYFVCFPRARVLTLVFLVFFFFLWDLPAWVMLGYWFAIQALSGLGSLAGAAGTGGIAWFAHIGGFLFGALLVAWFRPGARQAR